MKGILIAVLTNGCIILGITFLTIKILDWYNPFMNFAGQAEILQYLLCVFAISMGTYQLFRIKKAKSQMDRNVG